MTRIVSFNILAGGYNVREQGSKRTREICSILQSVNPDIVGVVEATHPQIQEQPRVIDEIAREMGMQLVMGGEPAYPGDYQLAFMTRLPILETRLHPRPGILNKPLLEVSVEEENGERLTVFVTHLWASFFQGRGGGGLRKREVYEILRILAPIREEGRPHVLMGDFNSLAPGDTFQASELLRALVSFEEVKRTKSKYKNYADGVPTLNYVVPPPMRFLIPMLRIIPRSQALSGLFNLAASLYAPRGSIGLLLKAGYIDCFRQKAPHDPGFTCPAIAPAGRIDYIFATPELAQRLEQCQPILMGNGVLGSAASDHLAMTASFTSQPIKTPTHPTIEESIAG